MTKINKNLTILVVHGKIFSKLNIILGVYLGFRFLKKPGPSGIKHLFINVTLLGKKPEG